MSKLIIYIAHPYSNDPDHNLAEVRWIYAAMSKLDVIPFCPWYVTVLSLDENTDRQLGMEHNKVYFERKIIDQVWVCGNHVSPGMLQEIKWANENGIPVFSKINEL